MGGSKLGQPKAPLGLRKKICPCKHLSQSEVNLEAQSAAHLCMRVSFLVFVLL